MRTCLLLLVACVLLAGCGGDSASNVAGTYELDRTALTDLLVDEIMKNMPKAGAGEAAALATAKTMAEGQAKAMSLTSVLNADGTWTTTGTMGGGGMSAKGTWTLEGTQLHLVTTEQDGKKDAKPETHTATLEGDVLSIQPEGAPFAFRLRRK